MAAFASSHQVPPMFQTPIVEPTQIINEMKKGTKIKFLDASWHMDPNRNSIKEYQNQRIISAGFFDIDKVSIDSDLPHMLPSTSIFSAACSELGLQKEDTICVYATKRSFSAPRVWWTFKCFGHSNVHVINGGLSAWIEQGGDIDQMEFPPAQEAIYPNVTLNESFVADWKQISEIINNESVEMKTIIDARSNGRFQGVENVFV